MLQKHVYTTFSHQRPVVKYSRLIVVGLRGNLTVLNRKIALFFTQSAYTVIGSVAYFPGFRIRSVSIESLHGRGVNTRLLWQGYIIP